MFHFSTLLPFGSISAPGQLIEAAFSYQVEMQRRTFEFGANVFCAWRNTCTELFLSGKSE